MRVDLDQRALLQAFRRQKITGFFKSILRRSAIAPGRAALGVCVAHHRAP